jgi:hypothetical protein
MPRQRWRALERRPSKLNRRLAERLHEGGSETRPYTIGSFTCRGRSQIGPGATRSDRALDELILQPHPGRAARRAKRNRIGDWPDPCVVRVGQVRPQGPPTRWSFPFPRLGYGVFRRGAESAEDWSGRGAPRESQRPPRFSAFSAVIQISAGSFAEFLLEGRVLTHRRQLQYTRPTLRDADRHLRDARLLRVRAGISKDGQLHYMLAPVG